MQRRISTMLGSIALVGAVALVAAGCTADADPGDGGGTDAVELTYKAADGTCASGPADGVDYEASAAYIEAFQKPMTGLVITDPLPGDIPAGTRVVFLNNDSPVAGVMQSALEAAAAAAEVEFINIPTGVDAQSINSALNSVVEIAPEIVVSVAVDGTFWQDQMAQLEANGTSIVYASNPNAEELGQTDSLGGLAVSKVNGDVFAHAAINFTCGTGDEFVFYRIPELSFSEIQYQQALVTLGELCADCNLRVVDISIADPSPADKIVSDLQAHPETDYFLSAADQFQIGLSDKAALAGITNAVGMGQSSLPPNIEQIEAGLQNAGFAVDLDIFMWMLLDEGLRKQQDAWDGYSDWVVVGQAVSRILTQANSADYLAGFVAYPDKETDFKALWGR